MDWGMRRGLLYYFDRIFTGCYALCNIFIMMLYTLIGSPAYAGPKFYCFIEYFKALKGPVTRYEVRLSSHNGPPLRVM